MNPESSTPQPKVIAATIGAAVSTILVYLIEAVGSTDLPTSVEGAIVTIVTFLAGYLKSN